MALVTDAGRIQALPAFDAWLNFSEAAKRAETAVCPNMALKYESIARASEERIARLVEQHETMTVYRLAKHGRSYDRASLEWVKRRREKAAK